MLERSLDFGVTTCVDMWAPVAFMQKMQAERVDGVAYDRADYLSSGIGATAPDSHGTQFGPVPTLTSPDEADAFVAARLAEGSDHIKIIYDNFKMFDQAVPTLDFATLEAVITAAQRRNMLAVVHSRDVEAFADVARAGGDGLVHAPVDEVPDGELVAALREAGIFVIPTLSVSTPSGTGVAEDPALAPRLSEKELANLRNYSPLHRPGGDRVSMDAVKALHEGGVTILAGSDSPNRGTATGVSIHQELAMLVAAGLTPAEALAAATSAPADAFGLTDRGRIRPGHRADLLLVEGDPASNITDSRRIVGVWKAGRRHAAEP
jgi:imidazolonepropionase-like amidohydrolase